MRSRLASGVTGIWVGSAVLPAWAAAPGPGQAPAGLGEVLPIWSCLPFAGMLLSIALWPVLAPRFWHNHFGKVSAAWAAALAVPFVAAFGAPALHEILHTIGGDYLPFIILLVALYTVSGGILLAGRLPGHARCQPGAARGRHRARVGHGDDRGLHADDPAAAAGQPASAAPHAPGGLLHLPGGQRGRLPHAARRPAPVSRLPARGAVFLDAEPAARDAPGHRAAPGRLLRDRPAALPQRTALRALARAARSGSREVTISSSSPGLAGRCS